MDVLLKAVGFLSACNPLTEEVKVADALDSSLRGTSIPRVFMELELGPAFFAIAFGSNFPAYGAGDPTLGVDGVAGDAGEPIEGDPWAL
jgi:hypothetical protein